MMNTGRWVPSILWTAALFAALLPRQLPAQYRGGSDPGRANFFTATDPRRLPGSAPVRLLPAQPVADFNRILVNTSHLRRFPPPPSLPAFPPVFTVSFPSLRDSYYAPHLIRDQAGQPALRTPANRREDRLVFQR